MQPYGEDNLYDCYEYGKICDNCCSNDSSCVNLSRVKINEEDGGLEFYTKEKCDYLKEGYCQYNLGARDEEHSAAKSD